MSAFFGNAATTTTTPATIQFSAADGDLDAVRAALDLDAEACNAQDSHGHSPLAAAVSYGHGAVARLLLSSGALATLADADGDTPLHVCASVPCAALILRGEGRDLLNARNADGKTPLQCHQEELDEVRMQLIAEQMVIMNANAATAEADARMREPSPETVAEVERLQRLVAFLEAGGDVVADSDAKNGGMQKEEEGEPIAAGLEPELEPEAQTVKEPPPSP